MMSRGVRSGFERSHGKRFGYRAAGVGCVYGSVLRWERGVQFWPFQYADDDVSIETGWLWCKLLLRYRASAFTGKPQSIIYCKLRVSHDYHHIHFVFNGAAPSSTSLHSTVSSAFTLPYLTKSSKRIYHR